jgi:phenylacetic acid degradation operon negative regulatory protein
MTANPRDLVLKLLVSSPDGVLSARQAVAACALFGIRENSVRVALVRLSAAGTIEATGRGTYRVGPKSADLAEDVRTWRTAESRVRKWTGAWLAVHSGALLRSERAAWRRCDRALRMLGFREVSRDLFVRPDNLVGGVSSARRRLHKLGLPKTAPVFVLTKLDEVFEARARSLWESEGLTESYVRTREVLEAWLDRMPELDPEEAARESFRIGNDAIRRLVFDPLLPDPLVDVRERRAFVDALLRFDAAGHGIWRGILASREDDGAASMRRDH